MTTDETLKRLKVDCLYGKKKHFNAADRKEQYHFWIGVPLTVINILTATVLFYVLTDGQTSWIKYIPLALAFVASFLSGFQTYFNFNKQIEGHKRVGNRYLALYKKADRLEGYISSNRIPENEIIRSLEKVAEEADDINKEAEQFATSQKDYNKAQQGIRDGEERYTEEELSI